MTNQKFIIIVYFNIKHFFGVFRLLKITKNRKKRVQKGPEIKYGEI